jgi:hypothetical protein
MTFATVDRNFPGSFVTLRDTRRTGKFLTLRNTRDGNNRNDSFRVSRITSSDLVLIGCTLFSGVALRFASPISVNANLPHSRPSSKRFRPKLAKRLETFA